MLSSYTRLTYCLAVIMMETTNSISLFLPIMITILISNGTSLIFNRSLYEYGIRGKQMPFLRNHLPKTTRKIRIREVVRDFQLDVCESVCSVKRLSEVLQGDYHSIPVVNINGKLIGLMPKNFLIVILENLRFYDW